MLRNKTRVAGVIWAAMLKLQHLPIRYVFMPLLDEHSSHWLLVCADCALRRFLVYDSLANVKDKSREALIAHAILSIALTLLRSPFCGDALTWEVVRADCPQQQNGYDCGVFVMAFMDLISIRATGWQFTQANVRQFRDKCLLSLVRGRITHFPRTVTG
uniref:Ubiquitin-like protease family profile domain-containing protein n=1 Tax=Opuntia streptacantha TaxID=393608 RepID=A0A7C8YVL5_OPUST